MEDERSSMSVKKMKMKPEWVPVVTTNDKDDEEILLLQKMRRTKKKKGYSPTVRRNTPLRTSRSRSRSPASSNKNRNSSTGSNNSGNNNDGSSSSGSSVTPVPHEITKGTFWGLYSDVSFRFFFFF
jgi:hypothetical protein